MEKYSIEKRLEIESYNRLIACVERKNNLIQASVEQNIITPQYARLLEGIATSTSGKSVFSEYIKVQNAIDLSSYLESKNIGRKNTIYLASGTDWKFPVALGARNIDMVDWIFNKDGHSDQILKSIEEYSNWTTYDKERSQISFNIDLGKEKEEQIKLNLVKCDVREYKSKEPLDFVMEFYGPTRPLLRYSPVFPTIATQTKMGTIIANFDYRPNGESEEESGIRAVSKNSLGIYEVRDVEKLVEFSTKAQEKMSEVFASFPKV